MAHTDIPGGGQSDAGGSLLARARRRSNNAGPRLFQTRNRPGFNAASGIKREDDRVGWSVKKEENDYVKLENPNGQASTANLRSAPVAVKAEDDNEEYTDFRLLSTSFFKSAAAHALPASGSEGKNAEKRGDTLLPQRKLGSVENRFNIIRLHTNNDRKVRMEDWVQPLRLTRKDPATLDAHEENPAASTSAASSSQTDPKIAPGGGMTRKKNLFQKKLRQVFFATDENRMLRREEALPWILEDFEANQGTGPSQNDMKMKGVQGDGGQTWIGRLDSSLSRNHVIFSFSSDGAGFSVIPLSRWYKFTRSSRGRFDTLSFEEAEDLWAKHQKNSNIDRWMMAKRETGQAGSNQASSSSNGPRGIRLIERSEEKANVPRFKAVDRSSDLFGEDDDDEGADGGGRRERDEPDEMDFEEEFADDEEGALLEGEDDEMKEMEEKIKREMREANRGHVGDHEPEVESAEEDIEEARLSRGGRKLKTMLRQREKRMGYASDDEEGNPYVSDEDMSGESETESVTSKVSLGSKTFSGPNAQTPATQTPPSGVATPPTQSQPASAAQTLSGKKSNVTSQSQSRAISPAATPRPGSIAGSRSGSPVPGGGAAVVARRATSPKRELSVSKRKREKERESGMKARAGSRENSPTTQEVPPSTEDRNKKPRLAQNNEEDIIREEEVVAAIEARKYATREILAMFRSKLKRNPANKDVISETMKKFASLVNHIVVPKSKS